MRNVTAFCTLFRVTITLLQKLKRISKYNSINIYYVRHVCPHSSTLKMEAGGSFEP
jgi:hypothetical protein